MLVLVIGNIYIVLLIIYNKCMLVYIINVFMLSNMLSVQTETKDNDEEGSK